MGVILLAATACDSAAPLLGSSAEPAVYLVLSRQPEFDAPQSSAALDSGAFALLVTMGTPQHSFYLDAVSFSMRRRDDGAEFDWTSVPRSGTVSPVNGGLFQTDAGNWRLPWVGANGRLGRDSLAADEEYELQVETQSRTITGRVVIPGAPLVFFEHDNGVTTVHWSRSAGAAAFFVIADTESPAAFLTQDTVHVLRRNVPSGELPTPPFIRIIAIDPNLFAMVTDTLRLRSGVSGALGVFGATNSVREPIPDSP